MSIWTDDTLQPIFSTDEYVDGAGTRYLSQFPKDEIPGLQRVMPIPAPDETPTAYTVEGHPRGGIIIEMVGGRNWRIERDGGTPKQVWNIVPRPEMSAAEIDQRLWFELRAERNRRLDASDIMVTSDRWDGYTTEQRTAWTAYRQVLRDLPETVSDPSHIDWPDNPA